MILNVLNYATQYEGSGSREAPEAAIRRSKARNSMCVPEKFEDLPMFLSPEQVAECTGMHVKSVRRCLNSGTIPGKKVGSQWRVYKYYLIDESRGEALSDGAEPDGD